MENLTDRKVLVVGLQRSGIGASLLLRRLGAIVKVADIKTLKDLEALHGKDMMDLLVSQGIEIKAGGHDEKDFLESELIVISPGVNTYMPLLVRARRQGIDVIGELELAYQIVRRGLTPIPYNIPFYAVTGTNGKSTVTTLLYLMLKEAGINAHICGNIGKAITMDIIEIMDGRAGIPEAFVVEVSSFQLETIKGFRPAIATILNITPDHLDRYRSLDEYRNAKALIGANMTFEDRLVLNRDDEEISKVITQFRSEIYYFTRKAYLEDFQGAFVKDGAIWINIDKYFELFPIKELKLKGVHNIENVMASSIMAILGGADTESIKKVLMEFRGLEHRTEFVGEIDGVVYINDSKGTNVGALMKSLEGFQNIILIAGGRDKKGDFSLLRPLVKERVKALVLIGEASQKIRDALGDLTETVFASDMRDAVKKARSYARSGDTVLLSPGCASFDMFRDFEERGRVFKEIVREMKDGSRQN